MPHLSTAERVGALQQTQVLLLRLGKVHLAPPTASIQSQVLAITDLKRLERLCERLFVVKTWQELLTESDMTAPGWAQGCLYTIEIFAVNLRSLPQ